MDGPLGLDFVPFSTLGESIIDMTNYLQITSYRLVNISDHILGAKSSNSRTDENMKKTGKQNKTTDIRILGYFW